MNFGFSEEQEMLRDQVRRFMSDTCPMTRVRELAATEAAFSPELWQQMADLGWLGLIIPEANGGVGLNWVDATVLLEETARGLCPLPLASHMLAAAALLRAGTPEQQAGWLPALVTGRTVATLALYDEPNWISPDAISLTATPGSDGGAVINGVKRFVANAHAASAFLLACRVGDGLALAGVTASQVSITNTPTMDRTKPLGNVVLDNVEVAAAQMIPITAADLAFLTDCGAVAVTAEMVGAAEACLALTSAYAKERIQFGKPIGQYQGVKHRLADMFVDTESFKSLLYYAAWAVDEAPDELPRAISLAKGYASDAFARIGIDGVGLHGAIGFTAEYDAQLFLKRSKWARPMYGDSDFHLDRVATLGGL